MKWIAGILSLVVFFSDNGWAAQGIHPIETGPIHEAFVSKVKGNPILESVPYAPPQPVVETLPLQCDRDTMWIPGYWVWSEEWHDFIWVSGVWRRPPPKHHWIPGYWEYYNKQWVRIPGFWTAEPFEEVAYLHTTPPDPVDEDVLSAPSSDYFWSPGYWMSSPTLTQYKWVSGCWQPFDPNWVLVPAHYVWRPDGYVFIPSYWDWPLDRLGDAFDSVFIEPNERIGASFEPDSIIETVSVIERCFPDFPDYLPFFAHHHHYNPTFWSERCCAPPWWKWETWWCLPWHEQWGLWWWYSRPGYPQPRWITREYASALPKPQREVFLYTKEGIPPIIVTPNGVVPPQKLINTITRLTQRSGPIFPFNPEKQKELLTLIKPEKIVDVLTPVGKPEALSQAEQKPLTDPDGLKDISKMNRSAIPDLPRQPRLLPELLCSTSPKPMRSKEPPNYLPPPRKRRPTPQTRPSESPASPQQQARDPEPQPQPRSPSASPTPSQQQQTRNPGPQSQPQPRSPSPSPTPPQQQQMRNPGPKPIPNTSAFNPTRPSNPSLVREHHPPTHQSS